MAMSLCDYQDYDAADDDNGTVADARVDDACNDDIPRFFAICNQSPKK